MLVQTGEPRMRLGLVVVMRDEVEHLVPVVAAALACLLGLMRAGFAAPARGFLIW